MKNVGKTIILIMALCITGSSIILAQHGNRGMRGMRPDSLRRSGDQMMKMRMQPDSAYRGMMRNHMRQMSPMSHMRRGYGMGQAYAWGPSPRFRGDYGNHFNHPGRLEAIPNLTDKQKKDITDLRQKHMDEVKKFREEAAAKINEMRESFRNNVKSQLTDEQKKFFDDNNQAKSSGK